MSQYVNFLMPIRKGVNYNRQLPRTVKGKWLGPPPSRSSTLASETVDTEVVLGTAQTLVTNELAALRLRR